MRRMAGDLAGQTLARRYEVIDLIGRGGMGEVYRARDRELDDLVALKVVRRDLLAVPEVVDRFRKEIKLARRVTHTNVARAFDLVVADDVTFYTMELVEGIPLSRRLLGPLGIGEAAEITVALCDALDAAHQAGVIHRDVKPANILLGDDGRIVLTDFGIATSSRQNLAELEGTPQYMAPEQARGEPATPAADIYALGVVLFEMLSGRAAFDGNLAEILDAKQRIDHLALDSVDPRLSELVAQATNRDPARRPDTAHAFRRAIAPFASARTRRSESNIHRAPPLPTVIVRARPAPLASRHLAEGFRQLFVDRLVQWPRVRVVPRESAPAVGTVLIEIIPGEDELELEASARSSAMTLRLPFEIEDLAQSVEQAARLIAVLAGSDAVPPPIQRRPILAAAHELILRARHDARRDRATLFDGVARCEQALVLAPGDPRVESALATCQAQLAFYDAHATTSLLDEAARHAFAALSAAPDLADAHFARAHVELHLGRPVNAAVCFRAAIARAPLMAEAHEWLGRMLLEAGFLVDAVARLEDAGAIGWDAAIAHALAGHWTDVDRLLGANRSDAGLGYRLRLASWRGDRAAEDAAYAELAQHADEPIFERDLLLAIYDPDRPWSERRDTILSIVTNRSLASARRRAFLAQLAAEAAGRAGDVGICLTMLLHASAENLFDLHWLDRCPLLDSIRGEPRFGVIRRDVATRAESIHDALYSEQVDRATVVTAAP